MARIASSRFNRALNTSRFQPRAIASKMNAALGRGVFLDHSRASDKAAIKGSNCKTAIEERRHNPYRRERDCFKSTQNVQLRLRLQNVEKILAVSTANKTHEILFFQYFTELFTVREKQGKPIKEQGISA